ncbi:alpha/beta fold hydrolase [Haloferax sp. S1W]|uniref:alpha/beta fold hydrolase n=1 Tax=Haloferax sp. S1W TaxID=3377110 RepID=UPI0037C5952C
MATWISESVWERLGQDGAGRRTVSVDGGRELAYAEYGCPDGDPVVFFHGTPGSRLLGKLFDAPASDHGVRLLAFERPGYGNSTPWDDYSHREAGDIVAALLDDAGVESAGLVAFSGGTPHALSTAATHPERVSRVDIVAGATPPKVGPEPPAALRVLARLATTAPLVLRGLLRGQAWLADRLDPSFVVSQYTTSGTSDTSEPISDAAATVVKADFVEAFRNSRRGAVAEFQQAKREWEIPFDDIEADVCFWHGTQDTNVPLTGVRRLSEQLPTARISVIDDADHLRTLLRSIPQVVANHGESARVEGEPNAHRSDCRNQHTPQ